MLFISISFLYYFLPIVIILYFIVPKKFKNFILFLSSIFFYFCGEPIYTFLMIGEIFIAYVGARYLEKYRKNHENTHDPDSHLPGLPLQALSFQDGLQHCPASQCYL